MDAARSVNRGRIERFCNDPQPHTIPTMPIPPESRRGDLKNASLVTPTFLQSFWKGRPNRDGIALGGSIEL